MGLDVTEVIKAGHHSGAEIGAEEIPGRRLNAQPPLGAARAGSVQQVHLRPIRAVVPNPPVAQRGQDSAGLQRHPIGGAHGTGNGQRVRVGRRLPPANDDQAHAQEQICHVAGGGSSRHEQ